jgi:hypothetical protein
VDQDQGSETGVDRHRRERGQAAKGRKEVIGQAAAAGDMFFGLLWRVDTMTLHEVMYS